MDDLWQFMNGKLYGVSYWHYATAFFAVLGGFLLKGLTRVFIRILNRATAKTDNRFDDVFVGAMEKPLGWAFVLLGIYTAVELLPFPEEPVNVARFMGAFIKGMSAILAIWFFIGLVDGVSEVLARKAEKTRSKLDDQLIPIVHRSLRIFLILLGGVMFLQNLGYSVGSLLAGLGIGGAALAFAAKDSLANVLGVLVIFLDRPFQIGDWIEVGDVEGTVEDIGLRVTRIRTFANSLITIPNSTFTASAINNWSAMKKRRIKMTVGVTYSTTADQMEELVQRIRRLIREDEAIHDDFFLVNFDAFGSSSLDVFIYCFTRTTNWGEFLEAKQQFMLAIMREVKEMGLSIAFPTRTVYMESLPGEESSMESQRPR